jgi:hypothetical protein
MVGREKHEALGTPLDAEIEPLVDQVQRLIKALASSRPSDLKAFCVIDPSEPLGRLLPLLEQSPTFVSLVLAKRIEKAVLKVATKARVGKGIRINLTVNAVSSVRLVLVATMRALALTLAGSGRKRGKQLAAFGKRSTDTLVRCCEMSELPTAWKEVLEFSRDAATILSMPLESFLSEENLGVIYQEIEQGVIGGVKLALSQGGSKTLNEISEILHRHHEIRTRMHQQVSSLISDRAGALPSESQAWALRELGLGAPEPALEYSDPADSPEVKQAASLLMLIYDEQNRDASFKEAFDRFRSLCETHFHLFLRGSVGSVSDFDGRLHEDSENTGRRVILVRPWVEWYLPPHARIVIRGIVEPATPEAGAQ